MVASLRFVTLLACCLAASSSLQAQFFPGTGGNGNFPGTAGIQINAEGVIELRSLGTPVNNAWKKQAERFAEKSLSPETIVTTSERVLSLKNLSAEIRRHLEQQKSLPLEIQYLAGLYRIDTIAFDRENKDIYLIGPADAFAPDNTGRMLSRGTGRPVLRLEDLIVATNPNLSEQGRSENVGIGCSIDPTNENMARLQEFLRTNSTPATAPQVQMRFRQMASVLGPQQISIWGVPANSHFAAALVEADLRMKRIAMGLDPAGVPGIKSHLSMLKPQGNSLQRWWFVPMYDPIETNADRTIFHLKGQRAKLLAQEEFSDAGGKRSDAQFTRQSTERFAQLFTEHFQTLADRSPAFAELQNLYDLAVVAALIRREAPRLQLEEVLVKEEIPLPAYAVPRYVPSASTFRSSGPGLLLGLVGGVTIDTDPVLRTSREAVTQGLDGFRTRIPKDQFFGSVAPAQ